MLRQSFDVFVRPLSRVFFASAISLLVAMVGGCAGGELLDESDETAECGNGELEGDEQCDDGNLRAGDGCSNRCESEATDGCGDGIVAGRELCDDTNTNNGDGCSSICSPEAGYSCVGSPSVCQPEETIACGDGQIDGDEACDDGGTASDDGCSDVCTAEPGFLCEGEPSVCAPVTGEAQCGNGIVEPAERCDDSNLRGGDGCSAACNIEAGWACDEQPSVCVETDDPICGNGVVEGGEDCDDGGVVVGDGCSAVCAIESGYACDGEPSVCTVIPVCGNGRIEAGEDCDDNNEAGGDGCDPECAIDDGWSCVGTPSVCTPPDLCAEVDCTSLDTTCGYGACAVTSGECEFIAHAAGRECDDGDPCTSGDSCSLGTCNAGPPTDCSSLDGPCSEGVCNPDDGGCVAEPREEGASCDTNPNDCSSSTCEAGVCVADVFPDCSACGPDGASLCAGGACTQVNPVTRWDFEAAVTPPQFTMGGSAGWTTTTAQRQAGTRSLRSGTIGNSTSSTATLVVSTPRPATVRFWYRVSSESGYDFFRFSLNGVQQLERSGTVNWTEVSYPVAAGTHTLLFAYSKDVSAISGDDAVFIDELRIDGADTCAADTVCVKEIQTADVCLVCNLTGPCDADANACTDGTCNEAGECVETARGECASCPGGACVGGSCRLTNGFFLNEQFSAEIAAGWTTGGRANWRIVAGAGPDGSNAAASGSMSANSVESWLQTVVTVPAGSTLLFRYRVSSEVVDYLEFYDNGSRVTRWSGTVPWAEYSYPLTAGEHTLRWRYTKDFSISSGSDTAWLDDVRITRTCSTEAECAVSVNVDATCVECPAANGSVCADGTCAAGVCL